MRAYCYRPSNVACRSITVKSPAKTTEPIEMPFGLWTWVGPRKQVLGGVYTGETWRIPLNRSCAAAMRRHCQITVTILLLGRIAVLRTQMQPIITDRVV